MSIFDQDLDKNPANYHPLTPLTFLEHSARVFPGRIAIIHGDRTYTYQQFFNRCRQLARSLRRARLGYWRYRHHHVAEYAGYAG